MFSSKISTLKFFALALAIFALVACGDSGDNGKKSGGSSSSSDKKTNTNKDDTGSNDGTSGNTGSNTGGNTGNNDNEPVIAIDITSLATTFAVGASCSITTYTGITKQFSYCSNGRRYECEIPLSKLGITIEEARTSSITCTGKNGKQCTTFRDENSYDGNNYDGDSGVLFLFDDQEDDRIYGKDSRKVDLTILHNNDDNNNELAKMQCGINKNDGTPIIPKQARDNGRGNGKNEIGFDFDTSTITPPLKVGDKITFTCTTSIGKDVKFDNYVFYSVKVTMP